MRRLLLRMYGWRPYSLLLVKKRLKLKRQTIEIAVAGISAGLMLLLLWLSVIVRYGTVSFYIAASVVLMAPICKKYYWAAAFAYIASSLLAFAIVGDILQILGFIIYFGPMTFISTVMAEKSVKPYITFPVKIVYINACLSALYFGSKTLFVDLSKLGVEINYAVIAVVGTLALLLLDTLMLMLYTRLKPLMDKAIKDTPKGKKDKDDNDSDDFEFDLSDENVETSEKQKGGTGGAIENDTGNETVDNGSENGGDDFLKESGQDSDENGDK